MPTIDQLAPGTAASDSDEFLVSQNGTARKITRAQLLAGVQPQLAVNSGKLIGRTSPGTGNPEPISIGANLRLINATLSANAAPFNIINLAMGTVPASGDLVPLGQHGSNLAVTYRQFMNGLSDISNLDVSQLLVTPTGAQASCKLADLAANIVLLTGGTLTGPLILGSDPTQSLQAATKRYVDSQITTVLPKTGGTLSGSLTLAADPTLNLHAATKQYVDIQVATAIPKTGGTLTGALILSANPIMALQAATKQYVDTRVLRTGDTLTGPLMLAADPTTPMQAATKGYVDNQMAGALPKTGGTLSGALTLAGDPSASLHAATKHYVDAQVATQLPLAGGTMTGPVTLCGNPTMPLHAASRQYVDGQVAGALPTTGGVLTGSLTLAGDPIAPFQAATKRYVDTCTGGGTGVINVRAAPYNALLNGFTDDTAAFKAAYQAAPAGSAIYVPNGVTVLQPPSNWGISVTKRVKWIVDGTTLADGTPLSNTIPGGGGPTNNYLPGIVVGNSAQSAEFSQNGSQFTDFAVVHSSYVVNHSAGSAAVIANNRTDTIIYNSPANYVWGGVDRLLWCGTQTPSGFAAAEHVGRYVQTIRQAIGNGSNGKPLPQPNLWSACLEYRDTTGQPSSSAASSITVELDWFGNGADDGSRRQVQSIVIGQHTTSGAPVEVSTILGVWLAAGSSGRAYTVFNVNVPFSTSVLDTTSAQQLSGAAAIRMAAGHSIAFEPTANSRLAYDSTTGTLRYYQGTLSYPVGKGISVGWQSLYSNSATLPNYIAGNIVTLSGSLPYTITLPAASTVAAGTGFTLAVVGSANVTIATTGSDAIDNRPVTLYPNDRYHVVSDGTSAWREVFRTNSVNPHSTGPVALPTYTVAALPTPASVGAIAFASNGRKPGEAAGAGTGVQVYYDGRSWTSTSSGALATA